eukprot:2585415-Rhodomonas_salina.4
MSTADVGTRRRLEVATSSQVETSSELETVETFLRLFTQSLAAKGHMRRRCQGDRFATLGFGSRILRMSDSRCYGLHLGQTRTSSDSESLRSNDVLTESESGVVSMAEVTEACRQQMMKLRQQSETSSCRNPVQG